MENVTDMISIIFVKMEGGVSQFLKIEGVNRYLWKNTGGKE